MTQLAPPEPSLGHEPSFGHTTRHELPLHLHTHDYHSAGNKYQAFNKKIALWLTKNVGTMTCFWLFCCLALCSLPSVLSAFPAFAHTFPSWMVKASIIALVAWIAQTFFQLVLLPALMVGQSLQNEAADARAAKTFEDVERLLDLLHMETVGGIRDLYDRLHAEIEELKQRI
jgi:hypothetical protein